MTMKNNGGTPDLWADKFTFFWYNAPEIFHWTQRDFDRKAKEMSDAGITRAMTFSVTHFRFCFYPFWRQIEEAVGMIAAACHKYGIKVIEHHSSTLTYLPETPESWEKLEGYMKLHQSSPDDFPGFREYIVSDPELEPGVRISDLYQIDGSTGKPAGTPYLGRAFCFNNPKYREIYMKHLRAVAERGTDAILADDVQIFGNGNACACKYCRALFREKTGEELPPPEKWKDFHLHFDDPLYQKWLRFREWTTWNFQQFLSEKYREWGISVLRPNYRARLLARDYFATTFSSSWECWEHVFQENMFSCVIRYSWPVFYAESLVQYAYGRRKNVPSMSLFYPEKYDQYYFSWALAESWGQIPFLSPEGYNMPEEDGFFNTFERKHEKLFRDQRKQADCAFLISRESLDHAPDAIENTYYPLNSLIQAACFSGLLCDAVCEDEDSEAFFRQKCIISVGNSIVTENLAGKLLAYLEKGGTLLVYGKFGDFDSSPSAGKILRHENVRLFRWDFGKETYQDYVVCQRMYGAIKSRTAPSFVADFLRNGPGKHLRSVLPKEPAVDRISPGFRAELYSQGRNEGHLTLHVLDLRDLLVSEGTIVSHEDPIIHYGRNAALNDTEVTIVLNRSDIPGGTLATPSSENERTVIPESVKNQTIIRIPPGTFSGYAVIDLQTEKTENEQIGKNQ